MQKLVLIATIAVLSAACSDRTSSTPGKVGSTQGSAVVLSHDERIAVAANRTTGSVTVFHLDPTGEKVVLTSRDVNVGEGSRPWAAVIGADDNTAYVLLRGSSERRASVAKVAGLRGSMPKVVREILVGSEPTAITITPNGTRLFVANSTDGTISFINLNTTSGFEFGSSPDLNLPLARTGYLGVLSDSWSEPDLQRYRPALAHPRAMAITDDGDDDDNDEKLFVTEFFSQPRPDIDVTTDDSFVDQSRQGLIYPIATDSSQLVDEPISLGPVDVGQLDAKGRATTCFPNQLYAAAVDRDRLFVTSMCASPRGPVGPGPAGTPENFKTLVHPAIFVVNTDTQAELPNSAVVMTKELDRLFAQDARATGENLDDITRMPLIPNDIAVAGGYGDGERTVYLSSLGADAIYPVAFDSDGRFLDVGTPQARFIDLHAPGLPDARLPVGIALSKRAARPFAVVLSEYTRNLATIDLDTSTVTEMNAAVKNADYVARVDASAANGHRLFATGLGAWSFGGQARSSCESCHPDGLSDGVTWFFARGPRRTISTAGTYSDHRLERRMMLWTASVDEIHDVEAIARGVSGGVGAVLWQNYQSPPSKDCRLIYDGSTLQAGAGSTTCPAPLPTTNRLNGLNGSLVEISTGSPCLASDDICDVNASQDWDDIDVYISSVRAPRKPTKLNPDFVRQGKFLYEEAGCGVCHGGPGWTTSRVFFEPSKLNNGAIPSTQPAAESVNQAAMRGRLRVETYEADPLLRNSPAANGPATFRSWAPVDTSDQAAITYAYSGADQINCVLRTVGTFPVQPTPDPSADPTPNLVGIVPTGAPGVLEMRETLDGDVYKIALAQGASGFNVPTLVGLSGSAPYFHAGNARTLEELFDPVFKAHYQAINPEFLDDGPDRAIHVRNLVSYLLSIDESTPPEPLPDFGFDPDPCAQFAE